jgi:hypothetical protein
MLGINVKIVDQEVLVNLESIPKKIHAAIEAKLDEQVALLREKVVENLSGKVLNSKSGALIEALVSGVEKIGSGLIGFVAVESTDQKVQAYAMAHEYGGKGSYEIVPVNKRVLRFVGKNGDIIFVPYVYHPPMPERSYLRSALAEMAPEIEAALRDAIRDAL